MTDEERERVRMFVETWLGRSSEAEAMEMLRDLASSRIGALRAERRAAGIGGSISLTFGGRDIGWVERVSYTPSYRAALHNRAVSPFAPGEVLRIRRPVQGG